MNRGAVIWKGELYGSEHPVYKLLRPEMNMNENFLRAVYVGAYPPGKIRISLAQGGHPQNARMIGGSELFGAAAVLELSEEHARDLLIQLLKELVDTL